MFGWDDLLIRTSTLNAADLLKQWDWLLTERFHPVVMTVFGDWFLQDSGGRIHMLDLVSGELRQVASAGADFQTRMKQPETYEEWFMPRLVGLLQERGLRPSRGECYGYRIPPVLGGGLDAENIALVLVAVHQAVMSQIHQQTRNLAPGATMEGILVDGKARGRVNQARRRNG